MHLMLGRTASSINIADLLSKSSASLPLASTPVQQHVCSHTRHEFLKVDHPSCHRHCGCYRRPRQLSQRCAIVNMAYGRTFLNCDILIDQYSQVIRSRSLSLGNWTAIDSVELDG
jgi:hypothetical protein